MAQNVHITHIEDTWANILANADHGQLAIKNNATAELPYEELLWLNDDGTYIYAAAAQRRYDVGGGSWGFLDAQFDAVTVNDTSDGLLVAKYVKHFGDTDTLILFDDAEDKITVQAGGVTFVDFTEAAQDVVEFNSAESDVDFIVNTDTADTLVIRGSDAVVAIGSASAPAWKTATYEGVLSLGPYSAIAGDGADLVLAAGVYYDVTDSRWEAADTVYGSRLFFDSDASYGGVWCYVVNVLPGTPGDATTEYEYWHAKATGDVTGELVINDGGIAGIDVRIETDNLANAIFVDGGNDTIGFGTASADRFVHIERDDATTDAVLYLMRLTHTCSGTVADGFGVGMEFELENATQATNYIAGSIEVIWEDDSDIDSDMIFKVMDGASAVESVRITSNKYLRVPVVQITDVMTNDTDKYGRVLVPNYDVTNESEGVLVVQGHSTNLAGTDFSTVVIGGGNASYNAAYQVSLYAAANSETRTGTEIIRLLSTGMQLFVIKSGATQVAAGASAGELWKTASHATLPDNVVMIGV